MTWSDWEDKLDEKVRIEIKFKEKKEKKRQS
jgi:hypothetical protein